MLKEITLKGLSLNNSNYARTILYELFTQDLTDSKIDSNWWLGYITAACHVNVITEQEESTLIGILDILTQTKGE